MSRRGCKFDGGVVIFEMPGEKPGRLQGRRPVRRRARGPGRRSAEKRATSDLPIFFAAGGDDLRSEEHTSELQSLMRISYAVFCLKKKNRNKETQHHESDLYIEQRHSINRH